MNLACRQSIQCSIVLVFSDTLYLSIFDPKVQKIWKVWKMCTSEVILNKLFPKSLGGGLHDVRLTFGGCILKWSILAISVNVWLTGRQGKHRASFLLPFFNRDYNIQFPFLLIKKPYDNQWPLHSHFIDNNLNYLSEHGFCHLYHSIVNLNTQFADKASPVVLLSNAVPHWWTFISVELQNM